MTTSKLINISIISTLLPVLSPFLLPLPGEMMPIGQKLSGLPWMSATTLTSAARTASTTLTTGIGAATQTTRLTGQPDPHGRGCSIQVLWLGHSKWWNGVGPSGLYEPTQAISVSGALGSIWEMFSTWGSNWPSLPLTLLLCFLFFVFSNCLFQERRFKVNDGRKRTGKSKARIVTTVFSQSWFFFPYSICLPPPPICIRGRTSKEVQPLSVCGMTIWMICAWTWLEIEHFLKLFLALTLKFYVP